MINKKQIDLNPEELSVQEVKTLLQRGAQKFKDLTGYREAIELPLDFLFYEKEVKEGKNVVTKKFWLDYIVISYRNGRASLKKFGKAVSSLTKDEKKTLIENIEGILNALEQAFEERACRIDHFWQAIDKRLERIL